MSNPARNQLSSDAPRPSPAMFWSIMALAVALRVLFATQLPFGQTVRYRLEGFNDEPSHYNYVRYLIKNKELPVLEVSGRAPDAFIHNEFEYHQPPVYYLLVAGVDRVLGGEVGIIAGRLLSVLFGVLTLPVIAAIFRRMGAGAGLQSAAMLFWALFLSHVYHTSVVSNDGITWLWAALITRQAIVFAQARPSRRWVDHPLALVMLLGTGLWIKSSMTIFVPVVLIAAYLAYRRTSRRAELITGGGIAAGSAVIAFPWYLRNVRVYGSLLNLELVNGPPIHQLWEPATFIKFCKVAISNFWFPMLHLPDTPLRTLFNLVGLLAMVTFVVLGIRYLLRRRTMGPAGLVMASVFLLNFIGFVRYNLVWTNPDGRFHLLSMAAIAAFFCVPLHDALAGRRYRDLWVMGVVLLLSAYQYSFFAIVP